MPAEMVQERIAPFVRTLRAAHPDTPILPAEDCTVWGSVPSEKGKLLHDIYAELQQGGVTNPYFVSAAGMMGPDDEGTVDGCHPTDLGFMYQADVFVAALKAILGL